MSKKKKKKKKRGPRRNGHQKAHDQKLASELRKEGKSLREIEAKIGLSHNQVRLDLLEIDRSLFAQSKKNMEEMRSDQLAKIRFAQIQAQIGWEKSLKNAETTKKKTGKDGTECTLITKGQSGDAKHIGNYIRSVDLESRLLGLLEKDQSAGGISPEKHKFWDMLSERLEESGGAP